MRIFWAILSAALMGCSTPQTDELESSTEAPLTLLGGKADQWDAINDPARFSRFLDDELEYALDLLPLDGEARKKPWPATYWPTYQDSTNVRWDGIDTLSPMEKYDLVFNGWEPSPNFMALRPYQGACAADGFDPEYYEKLGPAARWMSEHRGHWRAHDGIDNDEDGAIDECTDNDGIDTWWGLCHAWTPASLIEDEPVNAIEVDGITFYPSDLKALMITVYDYSHAVVIGGRCRAQKVERDDTGRILDPDCRDTNAGTFHVIMANFLGRFGVGFAEDRTYTAEVWNQPVHAYSVDRLERIDLDKALSLLVAEPGNMTTYPFNAEAKGWAEVEVTLEYVTESHPSRDPVLPNFESYLRTDRYHYVLELDGDDRIIGGEWINGSVTGPSGGFSGQPDFLWYPTGPWPNPSPNGIHGAREPKKNPHVSYTKVLRLFEQSRLALP